MNQAQKPTKTHTRGATHDVTNKTSKTSAPTETALHPTTPLEILVSRAMDQELAWYFSYAEPALRRARVDMRPRDTAAVTTDPTDALLHGRTIDIARIVRGCLSALPPRSAEVLRAVYTPRSWPKNVDKAFDRLSAIAVRLAFAHDPWPPRSGCSGLERATALRLSASLASSGVPVRRLRRQAQRLLGRAVVAYAGLRALEGITPGAL